ncbi:MAG: S24 family peptidase [Clostridiaceae bacterium]
MKNINKIIQYKPIKSILLRGETGSGKTTIALKRMKHLLDYYCHEDEDNVLLITSNRLLCSYASNYYDSIEKEGNIITLFSLLNKKGKVKSINELIEFYFNEYKKNINNLVKIATEEEIAEIVKQLLRYIKTEYKRIKAITEENASLFINEIKFIKNNDISSIEQYQIVKREKFNKVLIKRNSKLREAIFRVYEIYSKELKAKNLIDNEDVFSLAVEGAKSSSEKFTHIIVEDFETYKANFSNLIKNISLNKSYSSFFYTATKGKKILIEKDRTFNLKGNKHASKESIEFINSILDNFKGVKTQKLTFNDNKSGSYPIHKTFENYKKEALYIVKLIKDELIFKYKYKDIVIASKNEVELEKLKPYFYNGRIKYNTLNDKEFNINEESIKLSTLENLKGLHYKILILVGVNDNKFNSKEDALALKNVVSKCSDRVYFTGYGEATSLFNNISSNMFKIDDRYIVSKTLQNLTFIHFKRDKSTEFVLDDNDNSSLMVKDFEGYKDVNENKIRRIPLYNDIAAGSPIFINEEEQGTLPIPGDLLNKNKDFFILKISGDSMINANINNGDYVVIERTTVVDNMQIAAVALEDSATLKRVKIKGNSLLLISENEKYDPMLLHSSEVRILGTAVGLIKINS